MQLHSNDAPTDSNDINNDGDDDATSCQTHEDADHMQWASLMVTTVTHVLSAVMKIPSGQQYKNTSVE